jgi:uncharacterized protein (DUF433 family)
VQHLRKSGYEEPLTQLKFAVQGKQIYFMHPNGTWEGSRAPNQIVMHQVLKLAPLRRRIWEAVDERSGLSGRVERRRKVHASAAVFAGTRVPISAVQSFLDDGATQSEILKAYPSLTVADVRQAARLRPKTKAS